MKIKYLSLSIILVFFVTFSCKNDETTIPLADPIQFQATAFAAGLKTPIGMTLDDKGQLWVSEAGTGQNDGRVSLITTDGKVYPVITGFQSAFENGSIEGMGHLLYKEGKLYILNGKADRLYIADISSYKAGDPAIALSSLTAEDVGTYAESLKLTDPVNANAFNLTFGPNGDIYFVDAGSNAIFKRDKTTKALSLFAKIPKATATADAVPTSIVYDGTKFLVSTLSGAPFITGTARIVQVDQSGVVSDYKTGFTTMTGLTLTVNNKPLAIEFAQFSLTSSTPGFQPATGRIANETGATILGGLTMPTDIIRSGDQTYYVMSYAMGTIQKLTY